MIESEQMVMLPSIMVPGMAPDPAESDRLNKVIMMSDAISRSFGDDLLAKGLSAPPSAFSFGSMAYMPDPQAGTLMNWPGLPPESLQKLARTNVAPEMIISTRVSDVLRYSTLSTHPWKPGWKIEMRNALHSPTTHDKQDIRRAESFIANCNSEVPDGDPRKRDALSYDAFPVFLAKSVRDFLTYDSMAIWTDTDSVGRVIGFAALPAGNIRLAQPDLGYLGNKKDFAVMIDQGGSVIKTFTRNDLIWHVGNPRVDPDMQGYGWSRIEVGMKEIGGFEDALGLNFDRFQSNSTPMGMLLLKGPGWTQCFDEDTEVLTNLGWKSFAEVEVDKHLFATLNTEDKSIGYDPAFAKVWQRYEGPMYRIFGKRINMLVTPEHTVLFETYGRRKVQRQSAKELYESGRKFMYVPMDGHLPYTFHPDKNLAWFRERGRRDRDRREVSVEALECDREQAAAWLSQFFRSGNDKFQTASQLPDQVTVDRLMQAALHAGRSVSHMPGRTLRNQETHPYRAIIRKIGRARFRIEKVDYKGWIGCVSLKENKTLYVRRRGQPGWSGNTELDVIARQFANLKRGVTKTWALPAMVVPGASEVEFMDMSAVTGHDIQYQNHMNLVMGIFCTVFQFPHRRMGFRISGAGPDAEPVMTQGREFSPTDEEDVGLITLLNHYELVLNQYLIWTRWPHLQLVFTGKAPREDAREYESKQLARTWGEARAQADLPKLETLVQDERLKELARILELTPVDPAKAATFQNLVSKFVGGPNGDGDNPMFGPSKDPAEAQEHGAIAGVRRHS